MNGSGHWWQALFEGDFHRVGVRMMVCLIACLVTGARSTAQCPAEPVIRTGEATYYTFADGTGNCMFDATPWDLMIGAMNDTDYANSGACGECVRLTGPDGTITIRIVDRCPGCARGDIDLSPEAFSLIADTIRGRVPISWYVVPCEVTGPIEYHFKDGSNEWWTAVQIRNHRHAVHSMEYLDGSGAWVTVDRVQYNYFVEPSGMGPGPYSFRVTDIYGHSLVDSGIPHVENPGVPGSAQFPQCPDTLTGIREAGIPPEFALFQNYPNPFNPTTTIMYELPARLHVTLSVHDLLGRKVATLVDGIGDAGIREVIFDAGHLPGGVYYCRLSADGRMETRELLIIK